MNRLITAVFLGVLISVVAMSLLALDAAGEPLPPGPERSAAEATRTPPPTPPSPPTATPVDRSFAPVVFDLASTPTATRDTRTPEPTVTPPAPFPSSTPVDRAFAPVVLELGRSPTPVVTAPPPTVGPTVTPPGNP
ncbi:MAG: hypothetical protein KIT52_05670 [Anaerolineae bacterium]|nr:hypothetical protein [Anaerolineae bacterium]